MKKITLLAFLCIGLFLVLCVGNTDAASLDTTTHTIKLTTSEAGVSVIEDIEVKNTVYEPAQQLDFWIPTGAETVSIRTVQTNTLLPTTISGNIYTCNLSRINLSLDLDETFALKITYLLPSSTEYYQKTLTYDTASLMVFFNQKELYRGELLTPDASLRLLLYRPSEAPLNLTYILVVCLLAFLLIASALILLKKQRRKLPTSTHKEETEEILMTKKTLLLTMLKELEKQHRAQTISDETYTKLKDEYKQQAVDVMKQLDDLQKNH